MTTISTEMVDLRCLPPKKEEEKEEKFEIDNIVNQKGSVVCSLCGLPGHFSLACPKRKELGPRSANDNGPESAPVPRAPETVERSIKISNLPEETTHYDLETILMTVSRQHGLDAPTRMTLVREKPGSNKCKGYAYINYDSLTQSEKAVGALNGFKFQHVVLHADLVEADRDKDRRDRRRAGGEDYDTRADRVDKDRGVTWRSR